MTVGKDHPAVVCGLGASGRAAIRLLRSRGFKVLAADERDTPATRGAAAWARDLGCEVSLGGGMPLRGWWEAAVISPGIPVDSSFLDGLRRRRIPMVSELELGWGHAGLPTVAVTGSSGKSSVVKALADCFEAAGKTAIPCGNYGPPVCEAALDPSGADALAVEVSSFQLETCVRFRPGVAVLLNVHPNHLDRHGTFEAYARIKARLFARQGKGDTALVPRDWRERLRKESGGRGEWRTFGAEADADIRYEPGRIVSADGEEMEIGGSPFDNEVLGPNAAAVFGAARAAGLSAEAVRRALTGFVPLPHRAQPVGERDGVRYIDDSKATSVAAMIGSIRMQTGPVWLIAGGRPKETDFSAAVTVLRERVRGVFLVGEAAAAMEEAWRGAAGCEICSTLERAVAAARRAARPGDAILLAPACTSYDQFASYGERGDAFRGFAGFADKKD